MCIPVKINIDGAKVLAKVDAAWSKATAPLAEEILADCNEFCKEDTGALIASSLSHSQLDKGLLVWATPYARRQYWEIKTASTDVNPGATWRWCEYAKSKRLGKWNKQAQRLMEMNL